MALRIARLAALVVTALLAPLLTPALARDAWAQTAGARPALVVAGDGAASQRLAADLGALPDPWVLGDADAFARALGQRGGIGAALGNATAREALVKKARAAAQGAGATAVLLVRVTPVKNGRSVRLVVVAANDADPGFDGSVVVGPSDADALRAALAPVLARLAPAPAPTPSASAASPGQPGGPAVAPPPGDAPPPSTGGGPILLLSAGGGSGARIFRYHDGLSANLRPYDLPASGNVAVAVEVYPFARLAVPVLRGVGFTGGFQYAPGLASQDSMGTSVSTTWLHVDGGLRLRLPFGERDAFILGLAGGVVKERFAFGASGLSASLPNVDYLFGRVGADGRLRVGPVALLAGAAYLPAFASGDLADRFRKTWFAGVELSAGLAVPIGAHFELRAAGTYTRVFYAFKPEVGDAYVAGGALDHLIRAQVFATLVL
jgi:hypothetical protein